jgi:small subunit ribosomal protein S20
LANHISAEKRNRQNRKRNERNTARRSRVHSSERKLAEAIDEKDKQAMKDLLPKTVSEIARAKSKGVIHKRTASRKIARLSRAVNKASSSK